jgi:beta-lactamase regulating signal transducer with metallopeptidase domain
MSAAWLLYALVIGATLALGAHAAESVCRQLRLPTRWAWIAAIAILFVLGARPVRPDRVQSLDLDGLAARASTAATNGDASGSTLLAGIAKTAALLGTFSRGLIADAVRRLPLWVASGAGVLLALGALVALATLAFVHLRLRRARRGWPAAELHGSRVRIAPSIGPAVVGVLRPEIVVPRWLLHRSAEEQRLVMEHESEHLRGRDHLLLGAATVAVALVPWHPAVWWMLARLRLAIELDCDARVLRRGVPARTYGTLLIDLAGRCSGFRVGATALADEGSHLERRLLAMNSPRTKYSVPRLAALGAATALLLLAACESRMPTSAEIQSMDVASAERSAAGAQLMSKHATNTIFFVDGTRTDERAAHALTPNQISAINVSHGRSDAEPTTIRITTTGEAAANGEAGHGGMFKRVHSLIGRPAPEGSEQLRIRTPGPDSKMMSGLLFVDGVRADEAALRTLDPKTFQSVDVIKGPEAVKLYKDPRAANGVIKITTKK